MPWGNPGTLRDKGMSDARASPASTMRTFLQKRAKYVPAVNPAGPPPITAQSTIFSRIKPRPVAAPKINTAETTKTLGQAAVALAASPIRELSNRLCGTRRLRIAKFLFYGIAVLPSTERFNRRRN